VITPNQCRRAAQRARQVVRLKDLHHFLSFLQPGPPNSCLNNQTRVEPTDQDKEVGRSDGHQREDTVAISGEFRWPPLGRFTWPPSPERVTEDCSAAGKYSSSQRTEKHSQAFRTK